MLARRRGECREACACADVEMISRLRGNTARGRQARAPSRAMPTIPGAGDRGHGDRLGRGGVASSVTAREGGGEEEAVGGRQPLTLMMEATAAASCL